MHAVFQSQAPINTIGQRIVVLGTTGSGKSTLTERLSESLRISGYDLDALYWGPNWTPVPLAVFRERVEQVVCSDTWVIGGNYSKVRELIWSQAEMLIWLDYSLPLIFWRLFRRSLHRIATQEQLWGNNRERFRTQFLSYDSLFIWALRSHSRHRREYPELFQCPEYKHLRIIHLCSPRETERWLRTLPFSRG